MEGNLPYREEIPTKFSKNKPKMAYSRDAFPKEQRETRERDQRERLERKTRGRETSMMTRDGAMADGLTQNNEVTRECQRELERARES